MTDIYIKAKDLTKEYVSILTITDNKNHRIPYYNSSTGRTEFLNANYPQEIVNEVFLLWGDTPTVSNDEFPVFVPTEPLPPTTDQLRLNDLEETLATLMYGGETI